METATQDRGTMAAPADFVPLHQETRTHVSTALLCWHLIRKPQTARIWACYETYPEGLRPVRVMGRLAWPVAGIRMLLEQQSAGGAEQ
jgi:cephalosporin-C deacetylase-like acetyl esterase